MPELCKLIASKKHADLGRKVRPERDQAEWRNSFVFLWENIKALDVNMEI